MKGSANDCACGFATPTGDTWIVEVTIPKNSLNMRLEESHKSDRASPLINNALIAFS